MKARKISVYIQHLSAGSLGRILVFTGARQTGKTTLTRELFKPYTYLSIEDPVARKSYAALTASQWKTLYPKAILDEVQKEPLLVESIKSAYDQFHDVRYILLGSSQLLLLEKVRESLAGRCSIIELFPLTVPELETHLFTDEVPDSPFQRFMKNPSGPFEYLPSFMLDPQMAEKKQSFDFYRTFGGYPALTDDSLTDDERYVWLKNYTATYLERDIRDLASFRDLDPFIKLQQYFALHTGHIINLSDVATQIGLSSKTVQRYIRYFELSYQAIVLKAWERNETKRLIHAPKIHYMDYGVLQSVLQKRGGMTGSEFESLVIAELYKQMKTVGIEGTMYHLRTYDGYEIDLLIEMQDGYAAFEIKMASHVTDIDARHLKTLSTLLDKPLLHSFVVSNDVNMRELAPGVSAVNAAWMLG
jgi:uncharacterized protein